MLIQKTQSPSISWVKPASPKICQTVSKEASAFSLLENELTLKPIESLRELVKNHFGTSSSSSSWNPEADLNQDGVVNVKDKAIVRELSNKSLVRQNFGKSSTDYDFDPGADMNADGVVNVLDLAAVRNRLIRLIV